MSDIMDRVVKLLKQAEGTPFGPEADAFYAKAEELMIRHALDETLIRQQMGQKQETGKVVVKTFEFRGQFASANYTLCHAVGIGFGFKTMIRRYKSTCYPSWIGFENEIADAEVILASLLIQAARGEKQACQGRSFWDRQEKYTFRRSFIEAFGVAAGARIGESRRRIIDEVAATDNKLLPALIDRDQLLEDELQRRTGGSKAVARRQNSNGAGIRAGYAAGKQADIGSPRLGGKRELGR